MKNFEKNLEEATEKELLFWVNTRDASITHLASDELTRREIKGLNESLNNSTQQAKESSKTAEKFTMALFLLTVTQLLVAIFQLILSFAYSDNLQPKILGVTMVSATTLILIYFAHRIFPSKSQ